MNYRGTKSMGEGRARANERKAETRTNFLKRDGRCLTANWLSLFPLAENDARADDGLRGVLTENAEVMTQRF